MDKLVCLLDFENFACSVWPKGHLKYIQGGAGSELTLKNNRTAFSKFRILPKLMKNVTNRNLSITAMGSNISMPIGIAPTSVHKMACAEGECATAKAAEEMNTIFILSTFSSCCIEEVAEAAPMATKWFQTYIYKDRSVTENFVKRAEKSGFKAIVVTVDQPVPGHSITIAGKEFVLPSNVTLANFEAIKKPSDTDNFKYSLYAIDSSAVWDDIKWLRELTTLPIILKGILTAADALQAVEIGASGILVSNHGGRHLDSVPATIEVLAEIVKVVDNKVEIYLDGGIREGVDVFKALALGAKMVFVGRPPVWGLAYNGQKGAVQVLQILKDELDNAIALTGAVENYVQHLVASLSSVIWFGNLKEVVFYPAARCRHGTRDN